MSLYMMIGRQTVLDKRTQLLMPNDQFLQPNHFQLIISITFLLVAAPSHLDIRSQILDGIDGQWPILPGYEHIAAKYADVSNRIVFSVILADEDEVLVGFGWERDPPEFALLCADEHK